MFSLLGSEMLHNVFSDGQRAGREPTDIRPAENSLLGNSKHFITLLWNSLRVITASFPQQTIDIARGPAKQL